MDLRLTIRPDPSLYVADVSEIARRANRRFHLGAEDCFCERCLEQARRWGYLAHRDERAACLDCGLAINILNNLNGRCDSCYGDYLADGIDATFCSICRE